MSGRVQPPSPEAVGAALSFRRARLELGLSQREVAELAGVHLSTVSKIERAQTVTIEMMRMVAAVLQIRESWVPTYRRRNINTGRFTRS